MDKKADDKIPAKLAEIIEDSPLGVFDRIPDQLDDIGDLNTICVIMHRAQGNTWKSCAEAAGVSEAWVYELRNKWDIDSRAMGIAQEAARRGVLRMVANYDRAGEYIISVMDNIDATIKERLAAASAIRKDVHTTAALQIAARKPPKATDDEPVDRGALVRRLRARNSADGS